MGPSLLLLFGMIEIVSGQTSIREVCDSQIMRNWASERCNVNNYTVITGISENCNATCAEASSDSNTADSKCCKIKCMFSNMVDDGRTNKTAMAGIFGAVGDPQIMEIIAECEAIVLRFQNDVFCDVPLSVIATMYCTTWLILVKTQTLPAVQVCTTFNDFARKCFEFYNGTSEAQSSATFDNETLVTAVKLLDDPCDAMVDRYPSSQCMQKNFDGYRLQNELCTAKCNNSVDGCCMHNCLFLENGLLVTGSLNRTLFSKWLSKTGDAEDPQILACIDQCENLVKLISPTTSFCGVPESIIDSFYCTFWVYIAQENLDIGDACIADQKLARECLNFKNDTLSTVLTTAEVQTETTELSTVDSK